MNFDKSFFQLFDTSCFPVFVCDDKGNVIFKNNCAAKYMRNLRKGTNLFSRMTDQSVTDKLHEGKIGLAIFPSSDFVYFRSLIFTEKAEEKVYYIFTFIARLQMDDYRSTYSFLEKHFSSDFTRILSVIKTDEYDTSPEKPCADRLYAETLGRVCYELDEFTNARTCDMADFLLHIKMRCARAFSALGYRMNYSASSEFMANRFVSVDIADFSFSLFRALYAVMRNSENKIISIDADYDDVYSNVTISIETTVKNMENGIYEAKTLIPECITEIELLKDMPCYNKKFAFSVKENILRAKTGISIFGLRDAVVRSLSRKPSYTYADSMLSNTVKMLREASAGQNK